MPNQKSDPSRRFLLDMILVLSAAVVISLITALTPAYSATKPVEILNVSYDISRELFAEINPAFAAEWEKKTGQKVTIRQSHAGSTKQARSVADGLAADVVTFNQTSDLDFLTKAGLVGKDWRQRFPNNASPYYSLPIFLVRAGNPLRVKDWNDLTRVRAVFPNPKTSGNGKYTYLAAYAYALEKNSGDAARAKAFVTQLLGNVPVFDTGGRGATTTFVERDIGDVLVTFEAEVNAIKREYAKDKLEIVVPSSSLRAAFPVAVVDKVVLRRGTREVATAYLKFLYSDAGQEILAKHYNRVRNPAIAERYKRYFPDVKLVSVEENLGGWDKVVKTHFGESGILDQALLKQ